MQNTNQEKNKKIKENDNRKGVPEYGEEHRIEELQARLYQRHTPEVEDPRRTLSYTRPSLAHTWQGNDDRAGSNKKQGSTSTMMRNIFIGALVVFLGSVGFMFVSLSLGRNAVSNDNIVLEPSGKTFVDGGESLDYVLTIANNNPVPLELVDLVIEYPTSMELPGVEPKREIVRTVIGTIAPRQRLIQPFDISLFGEEGEEREILARLEYRVSNSTSIFTKESNFRVGIRSAPLMVHVYAPDTIVNNQEVAYEVVVTSKALTRMQNATLQIDFPSGFQIQNSEPQSSIQKNTWILGDLEPAETRTITIKGILTGEVSMKKTITARVGVLDVATGTSLATTYSSHSHTIALEAPFIQAGFIVNRSSDEKVAINDGAAVEGIITWKNTLPVRLNNVSITMALSGAILDMAKVTAQNGRYDSNKRLVVWNQDTEPKLTRIEPGRTDTVTFTIPTLPLVNTATGSVTGSPEASLAVSIRATGDDGMIYTAEDIDTMRIMMNSSATINQKTLHSSGPFPNTGPVPPSVGKTTTYTVQLAIHNSANLLKKGRLQATLPTGVTWMNRTAPTSQKVTYNAESRVIVWDIGDVPAAAGFTAPPRELSLQLGITPSLGDVGVRMNLLSDITFTATDSFTGNEVRTNKRDHSTQLKGDNIEDTGAVVN